MAYGDDESHLTYTVPVRRPEVPEDDPPRGDTSLDPHRELARCRGLDLFNRQRYAGAAAERRIVEVYCDDFDQMMFKDRRTRGLRTIGNPANGNLPGTYASLRDLVNGRVQVPLYRKSFWVNCQCGSTNSVGVSTALVEGTASSHLDDDTSYTNYQSDVITGKAGVHSANFQIFRSGYNPVFAAKIKTNTNLSNIRIWAGLFSANPTGTAGADYHAGFRFIEGTDLGWMISVKDGVTQKLVGRRLDGTGSIHPIVGETTYLLWLYLDRTNGKAYFMINDGVHDPDDSNIGFFPNREKMVSVNLPPASIDLGFAVRLEDTTLAQRSIRISRIYVEHD